MDIVIETKATFYSNITRLSNQEKKLYESVFSDSEYTWAGFRGDVTLALHDRYGSDVDPTGKKSIKVAKNLGRLAADVVVCLQYRVYTHFNSRFDNQYIEGIKFFDLSNWNEIINYPKLHYHNGTLKNSYARTHENYKPTVRMFKNARKKLIKDDKITKDTAPSYFVECLLYNVPNSYFIGTYQDRYLAILA